MKNYAIALIPGDGIGQEVVVEGRRVLDTLATLDGTFQFEWTEFPWGCEYYTRHGRMMAEDGLEQLESFDAIYLGAVGYPGVPDHVSLRELLIVIRQSFDQYVNLRPVRLLKGAPTVLNHRNAEQIQMTFVRENSEGEYAGSGAHLYPGQPEEVVLQHSVFSRKGTERIIRYAFELARRENKSLTSISKANALNYSMVFWDETFDRIKEEYPDVPTASYLVDAAAMLMVTNPERFEIVVTTNLFGDILTDLGAAISGGIGFATGANINPERTKPSMFEPVHGSAPDIAHQGVANPFAAIWSAAQMIEHLGYPHYAELIVQAIEKTVVEKDVLTPDLGGTATTEQVGARVAQHVQQLYKTRS